jgi:hypothetical protein
VLKKQSYCIELQSFNYQEQKFIGTYVMNVCGKISEEISWS